MYFKVRKYLILPAFTLAEVLITLSIIGIIAAMVIPSLVQDVQDAQLKTAWKKTYSDIDQATKRILMDNAGSLKGLFSSDDKVRDYYLSYLNYIKKCDNNNSAGNCWHNPNEFKGLNGEPINWTSSAGGILNNGTLMYMYYSSTDCTQILYTDIPNCAVINVDINGFKGPNALGKDIFRIWVMENTIKPFGYQGDVHRTNNPCKPTSRGDACSAEYLYK